MNNAMNSYKQTQFSTIGRGDLVIALFDGAIRFLDQAKVKIMEKDVIAKGNLISKAIDILSELDATLNMQQGGEVAKGLHQLYNLCIKNLFMANLKLDISIIESTQENIKSLRSAFSEAMQTHEAKAALKSMGSLPPIPANAMQIIHGGSINAHAEELKQNKAKASAAEALELAKQKMMSATNEQDKQNAQQEMTFYLQQVKSQNAHFLSQQANPRQATYTAQTNLIAQNTAAMSGTQSVAQDQTPESNQADTNIPQSVVTEPTAQSSETNTYQAPQGLMKKKMALYKNLQSV